MLVWKEWDKTVKLGFVYRHYKVLFLFGFIPLFIDMRDYHK